MPFNNSPKKDYLDYLSNRHFFIGAIIVVFLFFAAWSALTTRPESDEGSFGNPAFNLATKGFFGTTVFETENSPLTRIEQRTYWVMPLFLLNVAAFFKVLGFSLFSMRLVSIFWGAILVLSWYTIVLKLSVDRMRAVFCALMVACSYTVIITASMGRGDTMCAALGFAAFAVYLSLREQHLLPAIFLSQCLVVAAGLTHFLGFLGFLGLMFLTFYYDFRSLGWKHIFAAIIPYLVAGSAFGWWVMQDPQAFKDQFIDNALMDGRMSGFSSPFSGFIREFTVRYPRAFGLLEHSAGHSGPIYLKSLILVGYAIGLLGILFNKQLRRNNKVVLILMAIYFVGMSLLDGQKLAVYLIYIIPFYTVLFSLWLYAAWENRWFPRPLFILGTSAFILLQIGGVALRCKENTYGNYYQPTTAFLNQNVSENELVMGSQNLIFGLKPSIHFIADGRFGYYTGKRPDYIVYDPGIDDSWKDAKTFSPQLYEYLPRLLNDKYQVVYENTAFKVYKKR